MKAKIEVVETDKALLWGWIGSELADSGLPWVYRITSAYNAENQLTGVRGGKREEVKALAKVMAKKINEDCKGIHPFARPIKNNHGTIQNTGFNKFPGAV